MANQLLLDEAIFPSADIIHAALGGIYPVYQSFRERLAAGQISIEWRYYRDSKSWLGKCQHKKKTVFWLSVWEGFFKAAFFFTETAHEGVQALPFDEPPKREPNVGKFVPLVMEVHSESQLGDLARLIAYKKSLK